MTRGPAGTWTLPRPADWLWSYYTYRVTNYCPWTSRFEVRTATSEDSSFGCPGCPGFGLYCSRVWTPVAVVAWGDAYGR